MVVFDTITIRVITKELDKSGILYFHPCVNLFCPMIGNGIFADGLRAETGESRGMLMGDGRGLGRVAARGGRASPRHRRGQAGAAAVHGRDRRDRREVGGRASRGSAGST